MLVEPKIREFICTTAHPDGCRENVRTQIEYIKQKGRINGPQKVLIIGASTGYGLSSRVTATYGCKSATIGIMLEKPPSEKRTASAGFYNTKAFEDMAEKDGYYAKSINGDAFSEKIIQEAVDLIKADMGKVDMVIYSLASSKRIMEDGTVYKSSLKTIGEAYKNKTINLKDMSIIETTLLPATEEELYSTVKVMGGENWRNWIDALAKGGVLEKDAVTIAYSYIGPELTYPIYNEGTIGYAKRHLYDTSVELSKLYGDMGLKAYISVNKAVVTQASSAIPVVPLYLSILYKVMKEKNLHERCIEQVARLFYNKLSVGKIPTDSMNQIRLDKLELSDDVQKAVNSIWKEINSNNIYELSDIKGYWDDFYKMFGFNWTGIDYKKDVLILSS